MIKTGSVVLQDEKNGHIYAVIASPVDGIVVITDTDHQTIRAPLSELLEALKLFAKQEKS